VRRAWADHPPRGDRRREALQVVGAEVGHLEHPGDQSPGARADDDAVRFRQGLKTSGEVRRLPDHGLLLRGTLADGVAGQRQAGGDPDPRRDRCAVRHRPCGHGLDDRQPCAYRTLGIVLMGGRPAKVGEDPVAKILRDLPSEPRDASGDGRLVGMEDIAHVLGIQTLAERGGADEVREQHSQLPPLRRRGHGWLGAARLAGSISKRHDGLQQPLAVAEADPELFEVRLGELRQHVGIDVVAAERLRVLRQPQAPEPRRDVHLSLPDGRFPIRLCYRKFPQHAMEQPCATLGTGSPALRRLDPGARDLDGLLQPVALGVALRVA
jgi:hypothetical protein